MRQPLVILVFGLFPFLNPITSANPSNEPYKPCTGRPFPGFEKMGRGIDITELDLFPEDKKTLNGFRQTVIDLSCYQDGKWVHPSIDRENEYAKPDAISSVTINSAGDKKPKTTIIDTSAEFKKALLAKVNMENEMGFCSRSVALKAAQKDLFQAFTAIAETSATVASLKVELVSPQLLNLTRDFQLHLNNCTAPYEETPQVYDQLVATFGTHYFEAATFGGYLSEKTLIDEMFLLKSEKRDIAENLDASWTILSQSELEVENRMWAISDNFRRNSNSTFVYFGGLSLPYDPYNPMQFLEQWIPTVNRAPWLMGGRLRPIEELIRNETVRAEVSKAIELRKTRAYLEELKSFASFGKFRLPKIMKDRFQEVEEVLSDEYGSRRNLHDVRWKLAENGRKLELLADEVLASQTLSLLEQIRTLPCKELALSCTSDNSNGWRRMHTTYLGDVRAWTKLKERLSGMKYTSVPDHLTVQRVRLEAFQWMTRQEGTMVDICCGANNVRCNSCTQLSANCSDLPMRRILHWRAPKEGATTEC